MSKHAVVLLIAVLPLAFLACGDEGGNGSTTPGETEPSAAAPQPPGLRPIDPATAATVRGSIRFEGIPPVMEQVDTSSNKDCHATHVDDPLHRETVVVNDNGTLKDVLVYVRKGLDGYQIPPVTDAPAVLDQKQCRYVPHTLGVRVGQRLEIRNSDSFNHNVHFMSRLNSEWNVNQSQNETKYREGDDTFFRREVGTCFFKCEVHVWMKANVGIFDHPFFAVTREDGSFEIPGLPPGAYTIETWHELYGKNTQEVTLGSTETKTLDFTYTAR